MAKKTKEVQVTGIKRTALDPAIDRYICVKACTHAGRYWEPGSDEDSILKVAKGAKNVPHHFKKLKPVYVEVIEEEDEI